MVCTVRRLALQTARIGWSGARSARKLSTGRRTLDGAERAADGWSSWGAVALACLASSSGVALAEQAKPQDQSAAEEQQLSFEEGYEYIRVFGGTSNKVLMKEIVDKLGLTPGEVEVGRYADGEISIRLDENVRGKDVYIVQSGQRPVNDHLVELLLMVSTMQRASAKRVTAVIPYFPYKFHRRNIPASTELHSRFLWSAAADFGHMLEVMGVDRVISVDLERPGAGNESNFFSPGIPVETLMTTQLFAEHFGKHVFPPGYSGPVTVVSPSSSLVKKAVHFKTTLQAYLPNVRVTTFVHGTSTSGPVDVTENEIIGDYAAVKDRDVIIVDELIDTGGTLCTIAKKLKAAGAKDIYVYSSHGLFNGNAAELIEASPVKKVIVTNSIPLPPDFKCSKIEQVSIHKYLAKMIYAEHVRSADHFKEDYEMT